MTTQLSLQYLGAVQIEVCFEHIPGEPAGKRWSGTDCPATNDDVVVTGVMIQGEEVDRSLFAPALIEKWEHALTLEMME